MGKLIDRDVLVAHLERMMQARQIDRLPKSGYAKAIEDVAGCPTVDAVPVVRCKDCVHGDPDENGWYVCRCTGAGFPGDGYCSDGERR